MDIAHFSGNFLYIYLILINVVAFICFGIDKVRAKRNEWRIPESRLLAMSVAGGSVGALTGMFLFRHKTNHLKFKIGIPLILSLQIAAIIIAVR